MIIEGEFNKELETICWLRQWRILISWANKRVADSSGSGRAAVVKNWADPVEGLFDMNGECRELVANITTIFRNPPTTLWLLKDKWVHEQSQRMGNIHYTPTVCTVSIAVTRESTIWYSRLIRAKWKRFSVSSENVVVGIKWLTLNFI